MKKMNIYAVYLDDNHNVYKIHVPAQSKAEAAKYCQGNGNIVKITDETNDFPIDIDKVWDALLRANFGRIEMDIITRTLFQALTNTIN